MPQYKCTEKEIKQLARALDPQGKMPKDFIRAITINDDFIILETQIVAPESVRKKLQNVFGTENITIQDRTYTLEFLIAEKNAISILKAILEIPANDEDFLTSFALAQTKSANTQPKPLTVTHKPQAVSLETYSLASVTTQSATLQQTTQQITTAEIPDKMAEQLTTALIGWHLLPEGKLRVAKYILQVARELRPDLAHFLIADPTDSIQQINQKLEAFLKNLTDWQKIEAIIKELISQDAPQYLGLFQLIMDMFVHKSFLSEQENAHVLELSKLLEETGDPKKQRAIKEERAKITDKIRKTFNEQINSPEIVCLLEQFSTHAEQMRKSSSEKNKESFPFFQKLLEFAKSKNITALQIQKIILREGFLGFFCDELHNAIISQRKSEDSAILQLFDYFIKDFVSLNQDGIWPYTAENNFGYSYSDSQVAELLFGEQSIFKPMAKLILTTLEAIVDEVHAIKVYPGYYLDEIHPENSEDIKKIIILHDLYVTDNLLHSGEIYYNKNDDALFDSGNMDFRMQITWFFEHALIKDFLDEGNDDLSPDIPNETLDPCRYNFSTETADEDKSFKKEILALIDPQIPFEQRDNTVAYLPINILRKIYNKKYGENAEIVLKQMFDEKCADFFKFITNLVESRTKQNSFNAKLGIGFQGDFFIEDVFKGAKQNYIYLTFSESVKNC